MMDYTLGSLKIKALLLAKGLEDESRWPENS